MRNAFADELVNLAEADKSIVLLSGDIGNNLFNTFKSRFPTRFLNCGAAEAGMTGVAAGMALSGLRPVSYTIAAFNPGRCAEQVKLDICLHNLPVVVVGVGAGLSYASLGPTHHSLEDIAWMRTLPNMTIICPGDAVEARCALRSALAHPGPVYLRLGKKNEPVVHKNTPDFQIGRAICIQEGSDACILSVGTLLPVALEAAGLLSEKGVDVGVYSLHTVKPLDTALLERIFSTVKLVLVLEEHGPAGGAWSAVAEWLAEHPALPGRLLRCGTEDVFFTQGGGLDWAREHFGLTAQSVAQNLLLHSVVGQVEESR